MPKTAEMVSGSPVLEVTTHPSHQDGDDRAADGWKAAGLLRPYAVRPRSAFMKKNVELLRDELLGKLQIPDSHAIIGAFERAVDLCSL